MIITLTSVWNLRIGETALVGYGPVVTAVAAKGSTGATITYGLGTEGGGLSLRSKVRKN